MYVIKKSLKLKKMGKEKKNDPPTSRTGAKVGQAPALRLTMWRKWLQWILNTAGPKIFFVLS